MDSPQVDSNRRKLKRRSSSMSSLVDRKTIDHEQDLVMTKQYIIQKKNQARRNYRDNLIVKNRQIDFANANVLLEEPMFTSTDSIPTEVIKSGEHYRMDTIEIKVQQTDTLAEAVGGPTSSRLMSIKNKINNFKNNFRNIVKKSIPSFDSSLKPVVEAPPTKKAFQRMPFSPLKHGNKMLNPQVINEQHKRLTQPNNNNKLVRSVSVLNIKPTNQVKCANSVAPKATAPPRVKQLKSFDSISSLKEQNKPAFKLGTKIQYNDRYLFETVKPSSVEIDRFNKLITKRKIANHLGGSHTSINSIN